MKKLFALLLTLAMVLSLAACGGDTTAEDTTGDDTNTETQEPTGDTTLTTVEEGKLIMSTNAAFPPEEPAFLRPLEEVPALPSPRRRETASSVRTHIHDRKRSAMALLFSWKRSVSKTGF